MNTFSRGMPAALLSCALMSIVPVFQKLALKDLRPLEGAFWNACFCAIGSGLYFVGRGRWPRLHIREHGVAALLYSAGMVALMVALQRLDAASVSLGSRVYGILCVVFGAMMLGEKLPVYRWALIVGSLLGSTLYVYRPGSVFDVTGVLCVLTYALSFALNNYYVKKNSIADRPWELMFWTFALSSLALAALLLGTDTRIDMPRGNTLVVMLSSAWIGSLVGIYYFYRSLGTLSLAAQGSIRSLSPLFTALIAWPFFTQRLAPLQFVGGGVTLVCLILFSIPQSFKQEESRV